jgi:uncharacterized glyoxalase superfamily protein PhnB
MTENPASAGSSIREVYPYLCVQNAAAMEFYREVFGPQPAPSRRVQQY